MNASQSLASPKPLTATQRQVLHAALQRASGAVLPLPSDIKARGSALSRLFESMLKRGFVKETSSGRSSPFWREDADGQRFALRITAAGKAACMIVVGSTALDSSLEPAGATTRQLAEPIAGSRGEPHGKLGRVLAAVAADGGATLAELVELTGWQSHTARAALTGLRHRGYLIALAEHDGRRAYRATSIG